MTARQNINPLHLPALVYIAIVCFCISHTSGVHAQTHYRSNVSIGAWGGLNLARTEFTPSVPQDFMPCARAGVGVRYIEENHFGIIAELNWSQRGWKENFEEAPYRYSRTLNYIQLPVLAHIYFGRRGRFFINAGPEFSLFVGSSTSSNFNPSNTESLPDFPNVNRTNIQHTLDVHNRFDYGITGGLGGEFSIDRRNALFVEARFYYGLGNIFRSRRTDPFSGSNSMVISCSLGYWFRVR